MENGISPANHDEEQQQPSTSNGQYTNGHDSDVINDVTKNTKNNSKVKFQKLAVQPEEIQITADLAVAALNERAYLIKIVARFPALTDENVLRNAVRRYEQIWLPLQVCNYEFVIMICIMSLWRQMIALHQLYSTNKWVAHIAWMKHEGTY